MTHFFFSPRTECHFACVIVVIVPDLRGVTTEMEDSLNEELLLLIKEKFFHFRELNSTFFGKCQYHSVAIMLHVAQHKNSTTSKTH